MVTNNNKTLMSETVAFISGLLDNPETSQLAGLIPEEWVRQANKGYGKFEIHSDLISDSEYNKQVGLSQTDFFRLEICEAHYLAPLTEEGEAKVQFKVRITGIMNFVNGEMKLLKKGQKNQLAPNERWLTGFRSQALEVSQEQVEQGLISENDFEALVKFGKHYDVVLAETKDERAFYKDGRTNQRLWIFAGNEDFLFQFSLETRNNPRDGSLTLGITDISWTNSFLSGWGVTQAGQTPTVATKQQAGKKARLSVFRPEVVLEEGEDVSLDALEAFSQRRAGN